MNYTQFSNKFHDFLAQDPNYAVTAGIDCPGLGRLPDPSLQYLTDRANRADELTKIAASIRTEDPDEKLDLELAELRLKYLAYLNRLDLNGLPQHARMPRAGDDVGDGIFLLFINDPRPAETRLSNIQSRIEAIPTYLEARLNATHEPIARWVAMDLEKVQGLPSLFQTIENWASELPYSSIGDLKKAIANANSSLEIYAQELEKLPTTDSLHIGIDAAREIVRLKGIDLSLEEIHQIACDFLKRNRTDLEQLRQKLVRRYQLDPDLSGEAVQDFLNKKFRLKLSTAGDFQDILDRYEAERTKILKFIEAKELFPIPDNQEINIMKTPKFMEPSIPAGAMLSPAPFREGCRQSNVYLTLREDLLDEHTEISIPMMMVHEGIPGHHLQLTWGGLHPSKIRRHIDAMDQAEGWTTMLEDYMLDVGYAHELETEVRYVTKRDIARIGARVGIDLYFMSGDEKFLDLGLGVELTSTDPFEKAAKVLHSVTGFSPSRLQAELNWYSQERGYPLSYLTGNFLVWQLKNDFTAKHPEMDTLSKDRLFHATFLKAGMMPMRFLQRSFEQISERISENLH